MKTTTTKKKPDKKQKTKSIPEFRVTWKKISFAERLHIWANGIWESVCHFPNDEYPTIQVKESRSFSWLANTTWTSSELK